MQQLPNFEQKLLALLIAKSPDASPFLADILNSSQDVDWEKFEALVERHRVGALVHAGLQQLTALDPPEELTAKLAGKVGENARHYMQSVKLVSELTAEFARRGIGCASLKGIGIATLYYEMPSQREMIDVDLIVAADRFEEAEQIVVEQGFEHLFPDFDLTEQSRKSVMALHNAATLFRRSDRMQVDLHWRMIPNPALQPSIDQTWAANTTTTKIGGKEVPMPDAAMHFVYICVHGAKSGWVRLKWLADVDRVARGLTEEEAARAAEIFAADGLQRIGGVSLSLAHQILGTEIPAGLSHLLQEDVIRVIDVELDMIFGEMPSRPHKLKDWRKYRDRFMHSLLLKSGGGYRRHALLREVARPRDLATLKLKPENLWALGVLSPMLAAVRGVKRMAGTKD